MPEDNITSSSAVLATEFCLFPWSLTKSPNGPAMAALLSSEGDTKVSQSATFNSSMESVAFVVAS